MIRRPASGRAAWSLAAKLGAVGGVLLLLVLAAVGATLWLTWNLEGGAAAVNEAGRMRLQIWRLAHAMDGGDAARVERLAREFERSIALLAAGDPSRPLVMTSDDRSRAAFDAVRRGWDELRTRWTVPPALRSAQTAAQAEAFVASIDAFVSAIETRLASWTSLLRMVQLFLVGLTIVSAVTLVYAAHLLVIAPLARLRAGLEQLRAGELATRVDVGADDELGEVAAGFNRMADTLQGLYRNLESKVEEKTQRLELEHARLAALYEAAAWVARAGTIEELGDGFARQVRALVQADAAAVRWADESNRRYLLVGSACLPEHLVETEACIRTSQCLCGQVAATASTRVIPIRAAGAPEQLSHCLEAGYETVIGVPVRLHERIVGEIDLFFRADVSLSPDDRTLLEAIASHLAGAIESLRAAALEREKAVADERGQLARELHDSIAQSLSFQKIQVGLLRDALRRGDAAQVERVLGELDSGVRESLSDVRELLLHFRTRTNAEDIEPALRTTLQKFEHQSGLAAHLSIDGDGMPLAPDVQVQVLHVVQEALSNVRKHAAARQVWVDVEQAPRWRITVRDDGGGFDATDPALDHTHVGLRIMRERAQRIGATVAIESSPGGGTRVALTLPQRERLAA